ncbi:MAG: exo-alpha-sialidase [Muribaculaceae bacterium]|nr:exo-alpha-sialidase [Muribaculaceae bacterium]
MKKILAAFAMMLTVVAPLCADTAAGWESGVRSLVFAGPDSVSRFYRIPALAVASDGSIVAVADRRLDAEHDLPGRIDVVSRRSTDGGRNWQPAVPVALHDEGGGYGDPALGVDSLSGDLVCVYTHGNGLWQSNPSDHAYICVSRSADCGLSWSAPADITASLFDWEGKAPVHAVTAFASSGHILTARDGTMWFCLVVREDESPDSNLSVYPVRSTDGGHSWEILPVAVDRDGDESKMVELSDGTLLVSIRNRRQGWRKFSRSTDGGRSWSAVEHSTTLPDPACNGDILLLSDGRLLHSINDSNTDRSRVSLFLSDSTHCRWNKCLEICPGASSYSAMTLLPDGGVGVLSEEYSPGHGLRIWYTSAERMSDTVYAGVQPDRHGRSGREIIAFDDRWEFALGNASSPEKDFGCGTEYFNYLTKAASIHNEGPYSPKFDASRWATEWKEVTLPHDWVVDLPFEREASHSHGYKTVGFRYPETSVGWYRKTFEIPREDEGRRIALRFDGIFRDSRIWVNGFYIGHEPSGYATQIYDISEYIDYGGENLVTVRADASLEEGWFYEGAGIYRHVWLEKTDRLHVAPFGTFVHSDLKAPYDEAVVTVETDVANYDTCPREFSLRHTLADGQGQVVATATVQTESVDAKSVNPTVAEMKISAPRLWDVDSPHMYTLKTEVVSDGKTVDEYITKTGLRHIEFDADSGFRLNGKRMKLKGVNMHQDHPGVGVAIPDALQSYRLHRLKEMGVNAYRSSHNPMTPEMLDACDSLGILVVEENRLSGINDEHLRLLKRMIDRDRNHPSVILWSVGNEEWGIEWNDKGRRIAESMREYCHKFDSSRQMCVATSGGPTVVEPVDVAGYNYILQNPVDRHRQDYPYRKAIGSEETSGCGTRGIYFDSHDKGHMVSINRTRSGCDSLYNAIERGWKFYDARPWLGGLFYWTGFDYRGEPNPMEFPATGSQFGILDYCGFPKDEAYYLKSWWTDEPVLHIFPHWNLRGHEGEEIDIWAYSNCDEVELIANGKRLGRKPMSENGHLSWTAVYQPGRVKAVGYKNGKKILEKTIETTGEPSCIKLSPDRGVIAADGKDVSVFTVEILDSKGRFVPDADIRIDVVIEGSGRIIGFGNGDPAWQAAERPATADAASLYTFNGLAQILVQSDGKAGSATLSVVAEGLKPSQSTIAIR